MDDADLEKLIVKPGKLKPKFQRNVTEYEVLLNSGISELNVDPLTRDSNASWMIVGIGTERKIKITEGSSFTLTIEVSAEDGSTKQYNIAVTSLSASSTYINTLKIGSFSLVPAFKNTILQYECVVPFDCSSVDVAATSPDKNTKIDIPNSENKQVQLNYGATMINITVTSPDGSSNVTYYISVRRDKFVFPINASADMRHCTICLAVPHCPVSVVDDSAKYIFCDSCLQTLTRTNKKHPITNAALGTNFYSVEYDIDKQLSSKTVINCQFDCGMEVALNQYSSHVKNECERRMVLNDKSSMIVFGKFHKDQEFVKTECCSSCSRVIVKNEKSFHDKYICSSKNKFEFKHKREVRAWQKKYQQECGSVSINDAIKMAASEVKQYKQSIKEGQNIGHRPDITKRLERACQLYSSVIHSNDKNSEAHFQLGMVLEEQSYTKDIYGITAEQSRLKNEDLDDGEFQTDESMEDDIRALAEMRGFGANATATNLLKALDQEYHALLDQGQSEKADYVQKLYAFKQKQHHQSGGGGNGSGRRATLEDDSFVSKALQKYLDASSVDPNSSLYHTHVGRIYLLQEKYQESLERLRCALSLKPTNIEAKFYLALSMIHCEGNDSYKEMIVKYLEQGFHLHLFNQLTTGRSDDNGKETTCISCFAESFSGVHNTLFSDGIFQLSKLNPTTVNRQSVLEYLSLYSFSILSQMYHRGRVFHRHQLIVLETQYELGMLLSQNEVVKKDHVMKFWRRLSSVTKNFCTTNSMDILNVHRKICEACISLLPRSSEALVNLGEVLSSIMDVSPTMVDAKDVELLFRASIEVENTNIYQDDVPKFLSESTWWKKKISSAIKSVGSAPQVTSSPKTVPTTSQKPHAGSPKKPVATTAGGAKATTPVSSKPTASTGGAVNRGVTKKTPPTKLGYSPMKASGVSKPLPPTSRSKTDARRTTSRDRVGKTAPDSQTKKPVDAKATNAKGSPPTEVKKVEDKKIKAKESRIELNKQYFESRLGLARILKTGINNNKASEKDIGEAETLYKEVIEMAPHVHDAYIELGEILVKSKPMDAVAVYAKFPFSADASYDDAFLYGEIVRLLMKEEKYEDPDLKRFMICLGKVLGFSSLENYITVLENKLKYNKLLREIYAGVNNKDVEDKDLKAFFKFKCWE